MSVPDHEKLITALDNSYLKKIRCEVIGLLDEKYTNPRHGHFEEWKSIFESLTPHKASFTDFNQDAVVIGAASDISHHRLVDGGSGVAVDGGGERHGSPVSEWLELGRHGPGEVG
ncbi:MAG: hypothetical protein AAF304_10275, partial [Pseudomonadota bacterium]